MISSTGGKGGTGKSTFAILLALKLSKEGKRVLLCDCDVECPNDHLLLDEELLNPQPIYQEFPMLQEENCKLIGTCSEVCRQNAVFFVKGKYPQFFFDLCNSCGACWISCPNGAIRTKKEVIGESFTTEVNDDLWLLTGRSKSGVIETTPVVKETRERATKLARKINADVILIDTSPGTHCNVIQALLGCEQAYVVTEPTPLGAHDASLILRLLQIMKITSEIVLNKADLGNRKIIRKIAEDYDSPIAFEIPYSDQLVKAYSEGRIDEMVDLI